MPRTTKQRFQPRLMQVRDVCVVTSLSRTTIWKKVQAGTFPQPVKLGEGTRMAFVIAEVDAWLDALIAAREPVTPDDFVVEESTDA